MGLVQKVDFKDIDVGDEFSNSFREQIEEVNSMNYFSVYDVEEILVRQAQYDLWTMKPENRFKVPKGLIKFTPSSASSCKRELFYKAIRAEQDIQPNEPYQNRWTNNSTAIHAGTQKTILESNFLLKNPAYKVHMVEKEGFGLLPAWEKAIQKYKRIEHKGTEFVLSGMMDGILIHQDTNRTFGFEYKTKTNNNFQVHKMDKPNPKHVQQCVTYSLLFDGPDGKPIDNYLLTYESVAKDQWMAGPRAVNDVKVFHVEITKRQKTIMLNKYASVAEMFYNGELPDREVSKCLFCPFKKTCGVNLI